MGAALDLAGQTFGRRTVLCRAWPNNPRGQTLWLVRCACGRADVVAGADLARGRSVQCKACSARTARTARTASGARPWSREPDQVVVDLLVTGHRFDSTRLGVERRAAALRLSRTRPDLSAREIGETVGLSQRGVERARASARARG